MASSAVSSSSSSSAGGAFAGSSSVRPLAVCVGMGAAMLASVQLSRHHRQFWQSFRATTTRAGSTLAATGRAALPRRRIGGGASAGGRRHAAAAGDELDTLPRFLDCKQQLSQVDPARVSEETITVVQFNILASNLATRNHFPYVVDSSLNWDNRKMTLLRQLEELDADVVCLEELSDYWTFFKPELDDLGYDSVYVKRPSIHVSTWSGEKKQDGCGIFYKKDKFELKECESINFHDPHDRVAMLALLKMRHFAQYVLVGCTHLWWNPKKVDHQMAEIFELEEEIIRMSSDVKDKYEHDLAKTVTGSENVPIIICGDFNNSPESPLYEYMENTFMQKPNVEGAQDAFSSAYSSYHANMRLSRPSGADQAAFDVPEDKKDEPPHTTVNFRRCWTIDYIWHSTGGLVPTRVLEIPSEAVLRSDEGPPDWFNRLAMLDSYSKLGRLPSGFQGNHNGIPNSRFGSDHVPLMAEFAFVGPASLTATPSTSLLDDDANEVTPWGDDDEETKA